MVSPKIYDSIMKTIATVDDVPSIFFVKNHTRSRGNGHIFHNEFLFLGRFFCRVFTTLGERERERQRNRDGDREREKKSIRH